MKYHLDLTLIGVTREQAMDFYVMLVQNAQSKGVKVKGSLKEIDKQLATQVAETEPQPPVHTSE